MHNGSLKKTLMLGWILMNALFFTLGGCGKETSKEELDQISGRLGQLENKIAQLEGLSTEAKESVTTLGLYIKTLEERIDTLTQKIETMAFLPQKTLAQEKDQYHTVIRGETLYSISKKYGLSVDEVRRLNNLKPNQPIQPGQKLLVAFDRHQ